MNIGKDCTKIINMFAKVLFLVKIKIIFHKSKEYTHATYKYYNIYFIKKGSIKI